MNAICLDAKMNSCSTFHKKRRLGVKGSRHGVELVSPASDCSLSSQALEHTGDCTGPFLRRIQVWCQSQRNAIVTLLGFLKDRCVFLQPRSKPWKYEAHSACLERERQQARALSKSVLTLVCPTQKPLDLRSWAKSQIAGHSN